MYQTILLVLGAIGLADASYLIYRHHKKEPLSCPLNQECEKVTEGKYATTFGIRNDKIGFAYYSAIMIASVMLLSDMPYSQHIKTALIAASGLGVLMSIRLMWLQIYVIRSYCTYCMISAVVNALIFLTSTIIYLQN